ncbi:MAG: hypothetical protein AAF216_15290, partial [Pseudomonadota bacterium]
IPITRWGPVSGVSGMRTLLCVLLTSFSLPAFASETLGITGASLEIEKVQDENGDLRNAGRAIVDVAITRFHGFQGDLAYSGTGTGDVGTVAAHLYMTPQHGQKYGLFASLSDVDGRAMLYGSLGAEGMLSLGEDTVIEARAGMGWADSNGLDYVFAGASLAHQLTPSLELEVAVDFAEFDEVALTASAYDAGLKATYRPEGAPWSVYASATQSGLTDHGSETRLGLGISLSLGTLGGTDPHTRPFRTPDPVAALVRRGLW